MMAQMGTGRSPDPDEPQTVQLLPFRLGELLQRAERYARETLLPLISVQAPRFFGFNVTPTTAMQCVRRSRASRATYRATRSPPS